VAEAPAHIFLLAHTPVNDDLHRSTRPVRARQEHAFLDFNGVGQSCEGPDLAILQKQDDASSVSEAVRLDCGVQMKPDGKFDTWA
jgi:hypothetical protein